MTCGGDFCTLWKPPLWYSPASPVDCRQTPAGRRLRLSLLARDGRAWLRFLTNRFRVADILGKTVVIHADPDDFHTQPAGDSGMKVACGVIRPVRRR